MLSMSGKSHMDMGMLKSAASAVSKDEGSCRWGGELGDTGTAGSKSVMKGDDRRTVGHEKSF